jgi:excisionase family DNA binding protein
MKVTNRKVVADATLRRWEAERLASIEEAANRWGVSPWTVRYWIHHGKIASHKLSGRRLVPVSEIE